VFLVRSGSTTDPRGAGVHARSITSGVLVPAAAGDLAAAYGCNHALVTRDEAVAGAVLAAMAGHAPALATTARRGPGHARAATPAAMTVSDDRGGDRVGRRQGSERRPSASEAAQSDDPLLDVAFATRRGARDLGPQREGPYRFMTTRIADPRGIVRYFTPPITVGRRSRLVIGATTAAARG